MNQVYTSGRYIRRGLGCDCRPGFGDDYTDAADGGGGYYDAPPADSGSDYFDSPYYGSDYWDAANGLYYDTYGNVWNAPQVGADLTIDSSEYDYWTGGDIDLSVLNQTPSWLNELNADSSLPVTLTIDSSEYDYWTGGDIDLSVLSQTPSWLNELNADSSLPVTLPAAHIPPQLILQIPDSGIVPPGLVLPPVLNAAPPKKLAAIKKALQNQIQKAAASGSGQGSGASAGSKPQAVQPSQTGTCPPGYTLNAAKTACLLNQQPPGAGTGFMQLLQNPLVWILVLGAVVVSKR